MRVIGLTGKARSGKDTVAGILRDEFRDLHVVRQAFADSLKVSAARALGFDGPHPDCVRLCDELKVAGTLVVSVNGRNWSLTGREFLQLYGTESHRDVFGTDFWLDAVLPPGRSDCDVLLIPDVRFENEAERIHAHGGTVWRIVRPEADVEVVHASEAGLPRDLIDVEIPNTGTLDDLRERVRGAWLAIDA